MSLQALRQQIEQDAPLAAIAHRVAELVRGDPAHDLAHSLRVALWTLRLCGASADPRECIAAALLHDVVNVPKNAPDRAQASERSAAVAREALAALDFRPEAIERICDAIATHSYSRGATPRSALGRALQDADRLEALGALGAARCFATGAQLGARLVHEDDPWASSRQLDDRAYSVDHFFTKLLGLPETLCTEAGRAEARRRADFLRVYLEQLASELDCPAPPAPK